MMTLHIFDRLCPTIYQTVWKDFWVLVVLGFIKKQVKRDPGRARTGHILSGLCFAPSLTY